jgi:hypothetical protein
MRPSHALVIATLAFAGAARAERPPDERVVFLSRQLREATDERSRALSAMMLGAAGDPRALGTLCKALDDASWLVRSCTARALAELHDPAAADCLKAHAGDADPQVHEAVARSLAALDELARRKAFLYVAFGPPVGAPAPAKPTLAAIAEEYLRLRMTSLGPVYAPAGEADAAALAVEKERGLKGYYLAVTVVEEAGRRVSLSLAGYTYPERAPVGVVNVSAAGAEPEVLIRTLAAKAIDQAQVEFKWRP